MNKLSRDMKHVKWQAMSYELRIKSLRDGFKRIRSQETIRRGQLPHWAFRPFTIYDLLFLRCGRTERFYHFLLKCLLSIYTSNSFVRPSSFIGVIMISATAAGTRQLFPLERWTSLISGISPSKPRVESTLMVQFPSRHM